MALQQNLVPSNPAVEMINLAIRKLEPLVRDVETQYGKQSNQAKGLRIKLADLYAQRYTAAHPRRASRVMIGGTPRRAIHDGPIPSVADQRASLQFPLVVPVTPKPTGPRVNQSPLARRAASLQKQADALQHSIDVKRTRGGGKYTGMEAEQAKLEKISAGAKRANDLLKTPPSPEVIRMWSAPQPTRKQIEQSRNRLYQRLHAMKDYPKDSPAVQNLEFQIGQHDDMLAGREIRGDFYPVDSQEVASAREDPRSKGKSADEMRRLAYDRQQDQFESDHELASMSYAHKLQMPSQYLNDVTAETFATLTDKIGNWAVGDEMAPRGWYVNDRERRASQGANANVATYFVPGYGQIKGLLDLLAMGARLHEVGGKAFVKESIEGLRRVANPFEKGLTPEERTQRSIGFAAILYSIAHTGMSVKGKLTDLNIARRLVLDYQIPKELAVTAVRDAQSVLRRIHETHGPLKGKLLAAQEAIHSTRTNEIARSMVESAQKTPVPAERPTVGSGVHGEGVPPVTLKSHPMDVVRFARRHQSGKAAPKVLQVADGHHPLLLEAADKAGIEVRGSQSHVVDSSGVRHVEIEHGVQGKDLEVGQIPIEAGDYAWVPQILENPDKVVFRGYTRENRPTFAYVKRVNGTLLYLEEVGGQSGGAMRLKSLRKWPAAKDIPASWLELPSQTSGTVRRPALIVPRRPKGEVDFEDAVRRTLADPASVSPNDLAAAKQYLRSLRTRAQKAGSFDGILDAQKHIDVVDLEIKRRKRTESSGGGTPPTAPSHVELLDGSWSLADEEAYLASPVRRSGKGKDAILQTIGEELAEVVTDKRRKELHKMLTYYRSLPRQLLQHADIEFKEHIDPAPEDKFQTDLLGNYTFGDTGTIRISRRRLVMHPDSLLKTAAHEVGHHLQRWLAEEDYRRLEKQYYRAQRSYNGDLNKAYRLQNFGEWWAEEIARIVADEAEFHRRLEGQPALKQAYLKAIRWTLKVQRTFLSKLTRQADPAQVQAVYRQIVELRRVENALSLDVQLRHHFNTGIITEPYVLPEKSLNQRKRQ